MKAKAYLWCLMACFPASLWAQDDHLLQQLKEDEQNAVEAIALYPREQREAILEAAAYPEVLIRIQGIKDRTEIQFRDLLNELPEKEQKDFFNLSRYPEVINKLVSGKERKSKKLRNVQYYHHCI